MISSSSAESKLSVSDNTRSEQSDLSSASASINRPRKSPYGNIIIRGPTVKQKLSSASSCALSGDSERLKVKTDEGESSRLKKFFMDQSTKSGNLQDLVVTRD